MNLAEKISNAELEIMKILWREGVSVSSADLRRELIETRDWEKSTVLTMLRRLTDKGVVKAEQRDVRYYLPNVTEAEYNAAQTQGVVDRLYGGSAKSLVAALVSTGKINEADIDELKNFFRMEGKS